MSKVEKELMLRDFSRDGNLADLRKLFVRDKELDINATNPNGWTALMFASKFGHQNVAKFLLGKRNIDVNYRNQDGWTALMIACSEGQTRLARLLVVDVHATVDLANNELSTALMLATSKGYLDIIHILIQNGHANPNLQNDMGWTALAIASSKGFFDIVTYLIEKGHADITLKDKSGNTALEWSQDEDIKQYIDTQLNKQLLEEDEGATGSTCIFNTPSKRRRLSLETRTDTVIAGNIGGKKKKLTTPEEVKQEKDVVPKAELTQPTITQEEDIVFDSQVELIPDANTVISPINISFTQHQMLLDEKEADNQKLKSALEAALQKNSELESNLVKERDVAHFLTEELKKINIEHIKRKAAEATYPFENRSSTRSREQINVSIVSRELQTAMIHVKTCLNSIESAQKHLSKESTESKLKKK